nr:ABC transporter ATP-binding protein [Paenibacillus senegalensis]
MPDNQENAGIVLAVQNLKKKIGKQWIIHGVSFDIREGEVFGFLGPNGSGKTTTIRMLVDLIRPTEGEIRVGGISMKSDPTRALQNIGCIVENPELYSYMSGWDNLEHFARMLPAVGQDRIKEVVQLVSMEKRIHDKVKTYSLGMRQRLGIAQALLGRPKLLILDEPTNGLDPQGIKEMRGFIRQLAATGLSVFVSSHLLNEIQLMCDRVAIITKGKVIAVGHVSELLNQTERKLVWTVDQPAKAREVLGRMDNVELLDEEEAGGNSGEDESETGRAAPGNAVLAAPREVREGKPAIKQSWEQITSKDKKEQTASGPAANPEAGVVVARMADCLVPEANRQLMNAGIGIFSVVPKNPMLEELFLRLTEGESIG